ncbi:hypothetical protein NECID01_1415 [Nematocida sp. AWRm77]|nr:hypothetical protein NECID01_1415 [Nematocida sp. AWRm77]
MDKKYKQKKTPEEYLKEAEKVNYAAALEAKKTLDSITRTTEKTETILYEQREKLEEIWGEADVIQDNMIKNKDLSVKMKRAGKLITIGDKIGDKIKGIFTPGQRKREMPQAKELPKEAKEAKKEFTPAEDVSPEDSPTIESTNKVLFSIKDGLKNLHSRLIAQNNEIKDQIPLIQDITKTNKGSASEAEKIMKNLKKS